MSIAHQIVDREIDLIVKELTETECSLAKKSLSELIAGKNAYTCVDNVTEIQWNMITYKKGKKSSL